MFLDDWFDRIMTRIESWREKRKEKKRNKLLTLLGSSPIPPLSPIPPTMQVDTSSSNRQQPDGGLTLQEILVVVAIYTIWTISSIYLMNQSGHTQKIGSKSFDLNIGIVMLFVLAGHIALSCRIVPAKKLGALLRLGNPIRNVNSGFVFAPFGFYSLETESRLRMEFQIPDEPEKIDKSGSNIVADGKVFPIRVTHASGESAVKGADDAIRFKDDPLHKRMTTEWTVAIWLKITNYCEFLQEVGSREEAQKQLRDTTEATLKKYGGLYTPAQMISMLGEITEKLLGEINELVVGWGVTVADLKIPEMDLGHTVNEQLRNVPNSLLRKQVTETDADADKFKSLRAGEAAAKNREILLQAEATGAGALAKIMHTPEGREAARLELQGKALEKANFSILPSDSIASLIGTAKNVADEATKRKQVAGFSPEPEKAPDPSKKADIPPVDKPDTPKTDSNASQGAGAPQGAQNISGGQSSPNQNKPRRNRNKKNRSK